MSMCAGDFVEVYGAPEQTNQWDAVATCFFIDTAHNVVEYLEIIANCLKPGGVWVKRGPLLFHWSDQRAYLENDELSVEMSLADVSPSKASPCPRIVKREMRDSLYTRGQKVHVPDGLQVRAAGGGQGGEDVRRITVSHTY